MVARRAHNPKVVGSNPAPATNRFFSFFSENQSIFALGLVINIRDELIRTVILTCILYPFLKTGISTAFIIYDTKTNYRKTSHLGKPLSCIDNIRL